MGSSNWKLGLGGASSKWCSLSLGGVNPFSWTNQLIRKTNHHKLYLLHLLHVLWIYNKQHLHQTHHTHNAKPKQRDQHGLIKLSKKQWRLLKQGPTSNEKQTSHGGYHLLLYLIIWMVKQGVKNGTNRCVNRARRQSHSWMDISYAKMWVVHHHKIVEVEGCKNHTNKTNIIQGWCSKKELVEMVPKKAS